MKLTASAIAAPKVAAKQAGLNKVSDLLVPGRIVHCASGEMYRVKSRFASAGKISFKLADLQGKPVQTPANFQPVSLATAKLGAWFRFLAYNADFDKYVKEYIKAAGLPIDPKMNWAKWFQATYTPKLSWLAGKDGQDLIDEAIHQVIITSLLERNVLGKFQNEIKKYPPNVQQLPVEEQVTTYLEKVFKWRVSEAKQYIEELLRPEQEHINAPESEGEGEAPGVSILDTEEHATSREEAYGGLESDIDMQRFIKGFGGWLATKERPDTTEKYIQLFQIFWEDLLNGGTGKIGDIADEWKKKTGKGFDSLKVYYSKLLGTKEQEGLVAQYLRSHADELGEDHPLVQMMSRMSPQQAAPAAVQSSLRIAEAESKKKKADGGWGNSGRPEPKEDRNESGWIKHPSEPDYEEDEFGETEAAGGTSGAPAPGVSGNAPAAPLRPQTEPNTQNDLHNPPGQDGRGGMPLAITPNTEEPEHEKHTVPPELPNKKLHLMGKFRQIVRARMNDKKADMTTGYSAADEAVLYHALDQGWEEEGEDILNNPAHPSWQVKILVPFDEQAQEWGEGTGQWVLYSRDGAGPKVQGQGPEQLDAAVAKLPQEKTGTASEGTVGPDINNDRSFNQGTKGQEDPGSMAEDWMNSGRQDPNADNVTTASDHRFLTIAEVREVAHQAMERGYSKDKLGALELDAMKQAGANKEILNRLRESHFDSVGWSNKQQAYIVKEGYFYTHGRTEDKLAADILKLVPGAKVIDKSNHWNAWPKDSWFEVRFQLPSETPTKTESPSTTETINEPEAAMPAATASKKSALTEKIQARKAARDAEKTAAAARAKFAKLRQVASKDTDKVAAAFQEITAALGVMADGAQTLTANLGLVMPPKNADLKTRIAARRAFGTQLRQIAEEQPEVLENAIQEIMSGLDEIAAATEALASNLGVSAVAEPAAAPMEEAPIEEEVKDAAGSDLFITDRDDSGNPKTPIKATIPVAQGSSEENK